MSFLAGVIPGIILITVVGVAMVLKVLMPVIDEFYERDRKRKKLSIQRGWDEFFECESLKKHKP